MTDALMLKRCYVGDCIDGLREFAAAGIRAQTCVTSPPYWGLRDYGHPEAYGLEPTLADFLDRQIEVFRAVRDVLADDGTLWLNMGDSYAGSGKGGNPGNSPHQKQRTNVGSLSVRGVRRGDPQLKPKNLIGVPWRFAFALQADGWILRQDIIWRKKNPMPESCKDRCTKSHEYLFLLAKQSRYYYDFDAIAEPRAGSPDTGVSGWVSGDTPHNALAHSRQKGDAKTFRGGQYVNGNKFSNSHAAERDSVGNKNVDATKRNRRSVWDIATEPYSDAHFATFPKKLVEPCILAGSRPSDVVLDPFMGSGTTAEVAEALGRNWIGCEINPQYVELQRKRLKQTAMQFVGEPV